MRSGPNVRFLLLTAVFRLPAALPGWIIERIAILEHFLLVIHAVCSCRLATSLVTTFHIASPRSS